MQLLSGTTADRPHHRLLPLPPLLLEVLLTVAAGHERASVIVEQIQARTRPHVVFHTSAVYTALRRLAESDLLEIISTDASSERPYARHYAITRRGRTAVRAELDRLQYVLAIARAVDI